MPPIEPPMLFLFDLSMSCCISPSLLSPYSSDALALILQALDSPSIPAPHRTFINFFPFSDIPGCPSFNQFFKTLPTSQRTRPTSAGLSWCQDESFLGSDEVPLDVFLGPPRGAGNTECLDYSSDLYFLFGFLEFSSLLQIVSLEAALASGHLASTPS